MTQILTIIAARIFALLVFSSVVTIFCAIKNYEERRVLMRRLFEQIKEEESVQIGKEE